MTRTIALAALLVAAAAGFARAQTPPAPSRPAPTSGGASSTVQSAPRLQNSTLSLASAVQTALEHSTPIALANQALEAAVGRQRQAASVFDSLVSVAPSAEWTMQPVAPGLLVGFAQRNRDALSSVIEGFRGVTDGLQQSINSDANVRPICPANLLPSLRGFGFSTPLTGSVNVDRLDPSEITLLGTRQFLLGTPIGDVLNGIKLSDICTDPRVPRLTPDNFFKILRDLAPRIDQSGGQGIQGLLISVTQIPHEARLEELQIADAIAARARLGLQRMGPLPIDDQQVHTGLDATVRKLFRNGVQLSGDLSLQSQDHNFRDFPYDPSFGGLGQSPQFFSSVSGTLNLPLVRGLGAVSVAAGERSSGFVVTAERETMRHSVTAEAYRTTLAYLTLVAAQETLNAMQESVDRQQRIVTLTDQGVASGDLAGIEGTRARARAARVTQSVSAARADVLAARASLAETIGVDADSVAGLPIASDAFGTVLADQGPAETLVARALAARRDIRARQSQQASAEALQAGARVDARPRFNFLLTGGMSDLYESPRYRFLPDEQDPIIPAPASPPQSAIHYYSGRGYWRSLTGRYTPFVTAQLSLELPFGNNARRGRLAQTTAAVRASRIEAQDLGRAIRNSVVDVTQQLARSRTALEELETAARRGDESLQASLQRFSTRDVTLIDTITTEESATQDRLALIRQRQGYLSLLARLKYETGSLVVFDDVSPGISGFRFDASGLVAR